MKCEQCGMTDKNPDYQRIIDQWGGEHSMYWWNPKLSPLSDRIVLFCSAQCTLAWYQEKTA